MLGLVVLLAGPKGQARFAECGLITPARRSVGEVHIFLRRQPYNLWAFLEETGHGRANLHPRRGDDLNALLDRSLLPVWRGAAERGHGARARASGGQTFVGAPIRRARGRR